ncbi:MAG: methyltransferase domain-containing protein [Thermoanaerobaculia bacterium]
MNPWLRKNLVCPRDHGPLERSGQRLSCDSGHSYPIFDEVPVLLLDEVEPTHGYIGRTLAQVAGSDSGGASELPRRSGAEADDGVDPFVQAEIPYTSGMLYRSVQHRLTRYPIPPFRMAPGHGECLLDIGCNWGRWSVAAALRGYRPIGLDPSLDAVLAARRVARQLRVDAEFLVGDARHLPFADGAFDAVFAYGVFQHFSRDNALRSLEEAARVLATGGTSMIQMPNRYGVRQYQQHRRRGFTEGEGFEVRYWAPRELTEVFGRIFGPTALTADCYFGLGIQEADADLLPRRFRAILLASGLLRRASRFVRPLRNLADSVYLESVRRDRGGPA